MGRKLVDAQELDPGLTRQVLELLARVFATWAGRVASGLDRAFFDWKVSEFPGGSSLVVIQHESGAVGVMVVLRRHWLVNGVSRAVRDHVEVAVDASHRGQGLYSKMTFRVERDLNPAFDMVLRYLDAPQSRHVAKRTGDRSPANRIKVLVKVRSGRRLVKWLRARGDRIPALGTRLAMWTSQVTNALRYPRKPPPQRQWSIGTVDRFDERLNFFFKKAATAFDFVQERDMEYLNWRYADQRGDRFAIRVAEAQGEILGYVVAKELGERGHIADLLTLPGRSDVAASLLQDALEFFDTTDVHHIVCWIPRFHPYYELLRRAGFIDSHRRSGTAYRALRLDPVELAFLADPKARIHLMIGDSDRV